MGDHAEDRRHELTTPDTIAAVATPPGRGGIGIVRVSGPAAGAIAERILGDVPSPRHATLRGFRDSRGEVLDRGLALYLPGPGTFTGEDVLELHGHGGPVVLDLVLESVLGAGARLAEPGEFTRRAFLNDRLDLAQAEAVADLIDAETEAAARAARRGLDGALSREAEALAEATAELRAYVEAAIDFPEEEIDFLAGSDVAARLDGLAESARALHEKARHGVLLREGMTVVLAGQPNVGKSSLLNRLARRDAAIVTRVPGTTRDPVREHLELDGVPLHVVDTAGLRASADEVERIGVERAWSAIEQADAVLLVVDDAVPVAPADEAVLEALPPSLPRILVRNKIDLSGTPPGCRDEGVVHLSALTGAGVDALRERLRALAGIHQPLEGCVAARRRHLEALERTAAGLDRGRVQLSTRDAGELLAEELRLAQGALGEITGAVDVEDLLDRIFSRFCIGK